MTGYQVPKVSVGLPVYNGEAYIGAAIESVLSQTFGDLELVICDNASTDNTETICREYAAKDPRVRYNRNERNLGAGPNYNLTFERATSRSYFRWLAHDDVLAPTYIEKCYAKLEQDPSAVLCQSLISNIDEHGVELDQYDSGLTTCRTSDSAPERFGETILKTHRNTEIFGLVRWEGMKGSVMHGDYYLQDRAYVAEMSLRGKFALINEPLFGYRRHAEQFTRSLRVFDTFAWHNTTNSRWNRAYKVMLFKDYLTMVKRNVRTTRERLACYRYLAQWWVTGTNAREVLHGLIAVGSPSAYRAIRMMANRRSNGQARSLPS